MRSMCGAKAEAWRGLSQNASVMWDLKPSLSPFLSDEDRRVLDLENLALFEELGKHRGDGVVLAAVDVIEEACFKNGLFGDAGFPCRLNDGREGLIRISLGEEIIKRVFPRGSGGGRDDREQREAGCWKAHGAKKRKPPEVWSLPAAG